MTETRPFDERIFAFSHTEAGEPLAIMGPPGATYGGRQLDEHGRWVGDEAAIRMLAFALKDHHEETCDLGDHGHDPAFHESLMHIFRAEAEWLVRKLDEDGWQLRLKP